MTLAVSGTHVAAGAGLTPLVAQVLVYLTHWPLVSLDMTNATAIAGLGVAVIGGGGLGLWQGTGSSSSATLPELSSGSSLPSSGSKP